MGDRAGAAVIAGAILVHDIIDKPIWARGAAAGHASAATSSSSSSGESLPSARMGVSGELRPLNLFCFS